jgi:hypothetical protein
LYKNYLREDCNDIEKEGGFLIHAVQHMEANRQIMEENLDDAALLEEKLNVGREDCNDVAKEKNSSILEVQRMKTAGEAKGKALNDTALQSIREVKLTTHLHLVLRSRMIELYDHSPICLHGIVLN